MTIPPEFQPPDNLDPRSWIDRWDRMRERYLAREARGDSDDWDGFWESYSQALGRDVRQARQRVAGTWEGGVEEGLPLAGHFEKLRTSGFSCVDCFWRCAGEAIYGGLLRPTPQVAG